MKLIGRIFAAALLMTLVAGPAMARSSTFERDQTQTGKMFHKLGRGLVNVVTFWVEVPRNVAIEWERTDPVSGAVLGTVKGVGWGFARLVSGVYEVVTFPIPVPENYQVMMKPEFVVTDEWGEGIPTFTDLGSNDPLYTDNNSTPNQFRF